MKGWPGEPDMEHDVLVAQGPAAAADGKPIWAECGGMMSLFEEVVDKAGVAHRFGGLLPGRSVMQQRLAALGTQFVDLPEGRLAGHTFHYSKSDTSLAPLVLAKTSDGRDGEAIYRHGDRKSVV